MDELPVHAGEGHSAWHAYLSGGRWLSYGQRAGATLLPVQDGMLMDAIPMPNWPKGSRAVLVFPQQKVDINLTGIVRDEGVESMLKELQSELESVVK